jgi:nucleoside-diphosphate-sugar epimerase
MRILLAGATGVTGRRTVPALVEARHQVTVAGRSRGQRVAREWLNWTASTRRPSTRRRVVMRPSLTGNQHPATFAAFLPGTWHIYDRIRWEGAAILVEAALAGDPGCSAQEKVDRKTNVGVPS